MTSKSLCLWVRVAALLIAACGVAVCLYVFVGWRHIMPFVVFMWASSLPCFAILWLVWRTSGDVAREEAFTVKVAKRVKLAAVLLLADAAFFLVGNVALALADFLPPEFLFRAFALDVFAVSLAMLAAVLSRFIMKAAVLREDSEGTI